jgi:hypothetical protein
MNEHFTATYRAAGLATRTSSGSGTAIAVASLREGLLFVRLATIGAGVSVRPRWESSPASEIWSTHTYMATYTGGATGVHLAALSGLGSAGRLAWSISGTAGFRMEAYFVGKT